MGICCGSDGGGKTAGLNLTSDNQIEVKLVNLKYINDPTKKFKYLFPFYRMSIQTLDYKLDKMYKLSAKTKDTDLVHLKEMEKIFCTTPAWK